MPTSSDEETSDEDYETTSSSEEEEEPSPVRRPKKARGKVKPKKKQSTHPYQPAQAEDIYTHQMNRAFGSLLPNYNV